MVDEGAVNPPGRIETPYGDAAADLSLDLLASGAAWLRPDEIVVAASGEHAETPEAAPLSARALDALADHYGARLAEAGMAPGETILLAGAPLPRNLALIVGALRAGLHVALAAPDLDAGEIAHAATACAAQALAGPARFAGAPLLDALLASAAQAPGVRLVAAFGEDASGVVGLDARLETDGPAAAAQANGVIITFANSDGRLVAEPHAQAEIIRAAQYFVALAQISAGQTLFSTLSPTSLAGLISGPLAALLAAARLVWHAPFSAAAFLRDLDLAAPAHLIVPAAIGADLAAADVLTRARIASLTLAGAKAGRPQHFGDALENSPIVVIYQGEERGFCIETIDLPGERATEASEPERQSNAGRAA